MRDDKMGASGNQPRFHRRLISLLLRSTVTDKPTGQNHAEKAAFFVEIISNTCTSLHGTQAMNARATFARRGLSSVGRRWERDATLRFAPLTQHVLPLTPACRGISGFFFY
ncbi:MAG: hypothetical protein RRY13_08340 [Akkermansia sp.]